MHLLFFCCRDNAYTRRRMNHGGASDIKPCNVTAKLSFLNPRCKSPEQYGIPLNCSLFSLHDASAVNKTGKCKQSSFTCLPHYCNTTIRITLTFCCKVQNFNPFHQPPPPPLSLSESAGDKGLNMKQTILY